MAGRPRYTAAGLPYPLERDTLTNLTNRAAQLRMEQRRLASLHDRYEDDEVLALPQYRHARHGEDQRRADIGVTNPDRAFYPPSQPAYNDLDSLEPGQYRPFYGRRLSDSADEESDFDRHRGRLHRGPPRYDAAGDRTVFDDERHGSFHGWPSPARDMETRDFDREIFRAVDPDLRYSHPPLGPHNQLPFHARDMETRDFDGEIFRAFNPNLRYSHPPLGPLGSHDIELDRLEDLEARLRRSAYPSFYPTYDGIDPEPSMDSRDFGRVGTRAAGRSRSEYHFDDFEDDDLDQNFREIPPSCRPRRAGHRSDLDFRFVGDDSEDEPSGELRAPVAAGRRHRLSPVQRHDGIDAEELDAEDREWERQEAQIGKRYMEEDSDIDEIAHVYLRDERGRVPRAARPRPAANLSSDDLEESPRGRRSRPFRPRQAGNRQNSRRNPRTKAQLDNSARRTDTQQAPPSYDSVAPTQVTARVQAEQFNDPHHTSVAPTVSNNTHSHAHPVAAVVANKTLESTAREILRAQQQFLTPISQAKNGRTAHDGASVESDNDRSDSSDTGYDTPDEDSETSRAGDEISEGGDGLQTFIHITL